MGHKRDTRTCRASQRAVQMGEYNCHETPVLDLMRFSIEVKGCKSEEAGGNIYRSSSMGCNRDCDSFFPSIHSVKEMTSSHFPGS